MSEPLRKEYTVYQDMPIDLQLMAIWSQALSDYYNELTQDQIDQAIEWLTIHSKSY